MEYPNTTYNENQNLQTIVESIAKYFAEVQQITQQMKKVYQLWKLVIDEGSMQLHYRIESGIIDTVQSKRLRWYRHVPNTFEQKVKKNIKFPHKKREEEDLKRTGKPEFKFFSNNDSKKSK